MLQAAGSSAFLGWVHEALITGVSHLLCDCTSGLSRPIPVGCDPCPRHITWLINGQQSLLGALEELQNPAVWMTHRLNMRQSQMAGLAFDMYYTLPGWL